MNLSELYGYLMQARRDLWAALEAQPEDVLTAPLLKGDRFTCIKDLVFHIPDVEDGWIHFDLLRVSPVQADFPDLQEKQNLAEVPLDRLLTYWRAVEQDTLRHLPSLARHPERVVIVEDWPPEHQRFSQGHILWHVLLHEVRHTAQIAALLRVQGVTPPSLDLLFYLPLSSPLENSHDPS